MVHAVVKGLKGQVADFDIHNMKIKKKKQN